MRRLLLAVLATLPTATARAQEPLFLRIRPSDALSEASNAFARREAVWARSEARARIAIASVCTGCMRPMPPISAPPSWRHGATGITPESGATTPSVPSATRLATAGEP